MSHLQRLSIQGIRSFDPEQPQDLKFFPLTIIIGPNGAGKTSIIESLKYVTTAIMPPNSNSGKTFIHDVQFVDKPIVRGQIRLLFTDVERKSTIITRSMQAQLRYIKDKPQVTFRQINAVIKRENKSIDQKLADINNELLELIGVSKAVLNNVIFCHQEDIHWPLSEGKILKEKFDDIFGSVAYTKALESIKKCRDEKMVNLRLLDKDVTYTQHIVKEVEMKRKQIMDEKTKIEIEKEKMRMLDDKITKLDSHISELIENEHYAETMSKKISELIGSIDEKRKYADKLEQSSSEQNEFKVLSLEQINEKLATFDENFAKSKMEKLSIESKLKECAAQYDKINEEKSKFPHHLAKIDMHKNQLNKCFDEISSLINGRWCADDFLNHFKQIDKSDLKSIRSFMDNYAEYLRKMISDHQNSFANDQQNYSNKKSSLQQNYNEIKNEHDKLCMEIEFRKDEIRNLKTKIESLNNDQNKSESNENLIKKIDFEIENIEKQLNVLNPNSSNDLMAEMKNLEAKKKSLNNEYDLLKEKLNNAKELQQQRKFFDHFQQQRLQSENENDTIKMKNFELFIQIQVSDGNFTEKLMKYYDEKNVRFDKRTNELKMIEEQYMAKQNELKNNNELLKNYMDRLNKIQQKCQKYCTIDEYDNYRKQIEQKLIDLRKEKSRNDNFSKIFEEFSIEINENHVCPICERSINGDECWQSKKSGQTFNEKILLENLKEKSMISSDCKRSLEIDENIRKNELIFNELLSIQNDMNDLNEIKENIEKYKKTVVEIEKSLAENYEIEIMTNELKSMKNELNDLTKLLQDANKFDNNCKEIKNLNEKLKTFNFNAQNNDNEDVDELNCQIQRLEVDIRSCDLKISKNQKDFFEQTENRNKLQNLLQLTKQNRMEQIQKQQNQLMNMEKCRELMEKLKQNQQKLNDLEMKLIEIAPKVETNFNEFNEHEKQWQKSKQSYEEAIQSQQNTLQSLKTLCNDIETSMNQLNELDAQISQKHLDNLDHEMKICENEKKKLTNELLSLNEMIANYELNKRQLLDRQILLNLRQEIQEKESQLKEFQLKIGTSNITAIRESRIRSERERQAMTTQKDASKMKLIDLMEKIKQIENEITSNDEYANADQNYREKCLDKAITELICDDLDKCYKGLDNTITKVHKHQMEDINRLIDQFWRVSYQGNDIESIQIMVDQGERSASALRRTYHYRVTMLKQGKILDMRGRCSAGQKVLACIIIRIALAILFSNNFTVITLDEPTTNLDSANIRSLAKAIGKLRKMNEQLQIIIITHDEEFLRCLSNDHYVEQYYKVYKNEDGYSTIELHSVDDKIIDD